MTDTSRHDKRQFLRIPQEADVAVSQLQYPMTGNMVEATAKNLSEDGICFSTSTLFEKNTYVNLEIDLLGWQNYRQNVSSIVDTSSLTKPLTAIGVVVWSQPINGNKEYEIGVRFHDIYEDDLRAFSTYLRDITENR